MRNKNKKNYKTRAFTTKMKKGQCKTTRANSKGNQTDEREIRTRTKKTKLVGEKQQTVKIKKEHDHKFPHQNINLESNQDQTF